MFDAEEARRRCSVSRIKEAEIDRSMGEVWHYLKYYVGQKVREFKVIKEILKPDHVVRLRELGYHVSDYGDYYQIRW